MKIDNHTSNQLIYLGFLSIAGLIFLFPLLIALAFSNWLFLFFFIISWLPALIIAQSGADIAK